MVPMFCNASGRCALSSNNYFKRQLPKNTIGHMKYTFEDHRGHSHLPLGFKSFFESTLHFTDIGIDLNYFIFGQYTRK